MAGSDPTAPSPLPSGPFPGVEVDEHEWGIAYRGTKEALLEAGVLREEWMPRIPPGKKKPVARTPLPDGRMVQVRRAGVKAKVLTVFIQFTDEESAQRQPRFEAARMAERAHDAEAEIAKWPTSYADFARQLERSGCSMLQFVHDFAREGLGGYRVAERSMVEITEAFAALVDAMRDAEITFDPAVRAKAEALLRSQAASHDPAFGAFLDRLLTAPHEDNSAT